MKFASRIRKLLRLSTAGRVSPPAADATIEEQIAYQIECLPSHYLSGIGIGDFTQEGGDLVRLLHSIGGLRPDDAILDMGCGLGRVAIPLQRVIDSGSYNGFDIVADIIHWDTINITGVSPNFTFHHIDAQNTTYNPEGSLKPVGTRFPYPSGAFSFAFATSLFSHLLADATKRYLQELKRVLRPRGRAVLTFFLLDELVESRAEHGTTDIDFPHRWDHGRLNNLDQPEDAVAYDLDWLTHLVEEVGFEVRSIHLGTWSGHADGPSYQDVLVIRSPEKVPGTARETS